jgi:rRNA maturation RNase YbeY
LKIRIFYENTKWRLNSSGKIKKLIVKVIAGENYTPGDLNFIFADDRTMIGINREFLKHNYFTDVISFGELEDSKVSGEIYIGIETVRRNSINYKVSYRSEVIRVMIHGTLHLCGYDDGTLGDRKKMTAMEDYWLSYFESKRNEL